MTLYKFHRVSDIPLILDFKFWRVSQLRAFMDYNLLIFKEGLLCGNSICFYIVEEFNDYY